MPLLENILKKVSLKRPGQEERSLDKIRLEEMTEKEGPETIERVKLEEVDWKKSVMDLGERLDKLSSLVSKLEADNEEFRNEIFKTGERVRKLFKVYEIVFRGLNPFDEGVKEVDKDLLGEDVFEIFREFVGKGGGIPRKEIEELESRLTDRMEGLEKKLTELENAMNRKHIEEKSVEEEYLKAFEKPEEKPEPKWEVGDKALSPEGRIVEILEKYWDSSRNQWKYRCKPIEEAS